MNIPDFHTIDEYLLNRLEGAELAAFEQQLATDKALADEVAKRRQLLALVDGMGDLRMKARVRTIHQRETRRAVSHRHLKRWGWAIAAALVAALGLWFFWLRLETPDSLYAHYYEPYALSFGTRSTEADAQTLVDAGSLYQAGQFEKAQPLFEQVLSSDPTDGKARLAAGICNLEIGQYDMAFSHFSQIIERNDPFYGEQALWYAAMTYLRQNDVASCKDYLGRIVTNSDTHFYEKAKELLGKL